MRTRNNFYCSISQAFQQLTCFGKTFGFQFSNEIRALGLLEQTVHRARRVLHNVAVEDVGVNLQHLLWLANFWVGASKPLNHIRMRFERTVASDNSKKSFVYRLNQWRKAIKILLNSEQNIFSFSSLTVE